MPRLQLSQSVSENANKSPILFSIPLKILLLSDRVHILCECCTACSSKDNNEKSSLYMSLIDDAVNDPNDDDDYNNHDDDDDDNDKDIRI